MTNKTNKEKMEENREIRFPTKIDIKAGNVMHVITDCEFRTYKEIIGEIKQFLGEVAKRYLSESEETKPMTNKTMGDRLRDFMMDKEGGLWNVQDYESFIRQLLTETINSIGLETLEFGDVYDRDSNCDLNYVNGYNSAKREIDAQKEALLKKLKQ